MRLKASFDNRINSLLCSRVFHTENHTFIIMVNTQITNSTLYHPNPLSELKQNKKSLLILMLFEGYTKVLTNY